MAKLGQQETQLLGALDDLNERRRAGDYGRLPTGLDADTLAAVRIVQDAGYAARDADGVARPLAIPSMICLQIIRALRGEIALADDGGMPVPD